MPDCTMRSRFGQTEPPTPAKDGRRSRHNHGRTRNLRTADSHLTLEFEPLFWQERAGNAGGRGRTGTTRIRVKGF
jgi:hypothetical protein